MDSRADQRFVCAQALAEKLLHVVLDPGDHCSVWPQGGMFLVLAPQNTGRQAWADPSRWSLRLTSVAPSRGPLVTAAQPF